MVARPRSQQSWRAIAWCTGFALLIVGGAQVWLFDFLEPRRDSAYTFRRERLKRQIQLEKGRPVVVALGSSRVLNGVDGEQLAAALQPYRGDVVAANFAVAGGGPINSLALLGRLLRDGIEPDTIVVEVMPHFLAEGTVTNQAVAHVTPYSNADRIWLAEHGIEPDASSFPQRRKGLAIWEYRAELLRIYVPSLVGGDSSGSWVHSTDAYGSMLIDNGRFSEERRAKALAIAQLDHAQELGSFKFGEFGLRALEAIMHEGEQRQIEVVLVLMPEGDTFRTWYRPGAREEIYSRVAQLADKHAAHLLDVSELLGDADFLDSHHMLHSGSAKFSAHLGQQVGRKWVEDRAIAIQPGETILR